MTPDESMGSEYSAAGAPTTGAVDLDRPLSQLTIRELLAILRESTLGPVPPRPVVDPIPATAPGTDLPVSSGEAQAAGREAVQRRLEAANREAAATQENVARVVSIVGASPPEIQIQFLRGLAENRDEADRFMQDPTGYVREHGVLLDPAVVKTAVDFVAFDSRISPALVDQIGLRAIDQLVGMKTGIGGQVAWPAAVAAVAADTPEIAEDAIRAIKDEYEVLPHVVRAEDALKECQLQLGVFAKPKAPARQQLVIPAPTE